VPIVFATGGDPVRDDLVASLNRPGGNLAGVNFFATELAAKRLELLRELVPDITRVAVLVHPANPNTKPTLKGVEAAARSMGLQVQAFNAAAPLLFALAEVSSPVTAFLLVLAALVIASFYTSISGVVKAELFPTEVRALGVGLTYAVANAIFGGTAEYVALWLTSSGQEQWFACYVSGIVAIGLAASLIMPDTRKYGYLEGSGEVE
jgi:alpha-beta hydrolase superfamily lysophospholipase